ncbi:PREDICTED: putative odorant receptor 92a [Trachymyrmex septentrionalis]|uniref:putative odorant receptor 92a n=1 Tax=Trachymyrmex septentrionalis TaxID=34720 RepID=UPI00084EED99|nr:PREDICTED: putative odorant receptor 92a [Trachymyrmex septentrionalis]
MDKIRTWPNENHEKDVIDILIWNRWLLRVLGIWPLIYPNTTIIEKILATFSFASCWIVLGLFLVLTSMYTFTDRSIMGEKMKMLGPLGYVFFSMLKYLFLVIRHKSIRRCVQILSTDWRMVQEKNHREIMMRDAEKGHLLSKFCIVFMYCGGLSYNTVMPFLSQTSYANKQNVTIRPMAYLGFDIVFDLQLMPVYVFAFSLQCFIGIVMFNITTSVCCLAAMFVAHACGQIDIVIASVENLFKGERDHIKFEKYMAIIVQHHVKTLRFSAGIEDTLRELCLVEIVGTTLIMCLVEYSLLTEWNNSDGIAIFTYFFLFVSFVFNIFIFCYIGELLTEQCSKVGNTTYTIEWYNLPGKVALDLMLMINMSGHPVQITAGRLLSLSFANFGNVLKTSVAYLNLLRTAIR